MKITVEIPDGENCNGCMFLVEEYEAGEFWCKRMKDDDNFLADFEDDLDTQIIPKHSKCEQ